MSLPWPPTADDLEANTSEGLLPPDLTKFLMVILSGDADNEATRRIIFSVGQVFICYYFEL